MAAELRRTHQEQIAGNHRDAFEALQWFEQRGAYLEVDAPSGDRRGGYVSRDEEADDGSYEAVIINPDRSRQVVRGLTLLGAIESLKERLS